MTKSEQVAQLALLRAYKRCDGLVMPTDNQRETIKILRGLNPSAVLSLDGTTGIKIHGVSWGNYRVARAA